MSITSQGKLLILLSPSYVVQIGFVSVLCPVLYLFNVLDTLIKTKCRLDSGSLVITRNKQGQKIPLTKSWKLASSREVMIWEMKLTSCLSYRRFLNEGKMGIQEGTFYPTLGWARGAGSILSIWFIVVLLSTRNTEMLLFNNLCNVVIYSALYI